MLTLRNAILEMIAKGADLTATIDRLCLSIEALAPGVCCSVLLVDSDGALHPLSAPSLPEAYSAALDGLLIGPDVGSCGSAAWSGAPVEVSDIASDPKWALFRDAPLALGLKACWSTPVLGEAGNVIATFALYFPEPRGPNAIEREAVQASIYLCSIAIERHNRLVELERRANIDTLTGLANRATFVRDLARLPVHPAGSWGLFIVDLDNLKVVNDNFGHSAGDILIQAVAARIEQGAPGERTYRIGGDEFAVILRSSESLSDLDGLATRILGTVCEPILSDGHSLIPRATIGGAVLAAGDSSGELVRQNADYALYHAKETLRGGFVRYWPGIDTRIIHRMAAIRDVQAALHQNRIEAFYQPVYCLTTRRIVALEALCRLRMAGGGVLAAAAFREATSDVQIASELTGRMLDIVARDILDWSRAGVVLDHVGLNVSLADFHGGKLHDQIAAAAARDSGLLSQLVIEVTEGAYPVLRDPAVTSQLDSLRTRGLRTALDDFGTSGGMLMTLLTMPVDMIKIDRVLVARLEGDVAGEAVISGLLNTARELRISVVAKGIESEPQSTHLRKLGCRFGQGHLFAKALDRTDVTNLLLSAQDISQSDKRIGLR